jgi:hypothetical protein
MQAAMFDRAVSNSRFSDYSGFQLIVEKSPNGPLNLRSTGTSR